MNSVVGYTHVMLRPVVITGVLVFSVFTSSVYGISAYETAQVRDRIDTDILYPVPVETDYIPNVVQAENGGASFEALKAQAVAARTYLYYKMETAGAIYDGTKDQVYSNGYPPLQNISMQALPPNVKYYVTVIHPEQ
ncbi:MAG: SpoIID/LytB domain-containing protein [Phycisphaerales bacterium]|nr:SpoIID/LytB domain-containing protein [Phycisphaerales bacterium]